MIVNSQRVTVLWRLSWEEQTLSCAVHRTEGGFELRLESPTGVVLAVPYDIRPRLMARFDRLKATLKRHGWREEPV